MGKEQKNFLLPDEHIYHPLLRNAISVPPTTPMSLAQAREQHRPAIEEARKNTGLYRFARVDMIPIGYFLHDWQRSPLAQEIRRYAPQVFPAPY